MNILRSINRVYSHVLSGLLVVSVAILIFPVSLQVFSRYTDLIPSYIWTEEMARFLFIWMIMIGAMIGIRESTHFEVDVWPRLGPRGAAILKIVSSLFVLFMAGIFSVLRLGVHALRLQPHFGTRRAAAVADPHGLAADRPHVDHLPGRTDDRRRARAA